MGVGGQRTVKCTILWEVCGLPNCRSGIRGRFVSLYRFPLVHFKLCAMKLQDRMRVIRENARCQWFTPVILATQEAEISSSKPA
jgi:hypothetical protein